MKRNRLLITLTIVLILLVGCGVAPTQEPAAGAANFTNTTTREVNIDPVLITSAERVPGAWQASLAQGQPVVGRYQAQPLPNGQIALKLESDACRLSSLIVSAGEIPGILSTSLAQGQSVVGRYETQLLPNGEVAIKLKKAEAAGELAC